MADNFEVSFNSPQCGWMSVGFKTREREFHTTTAYTPHSEALVEIMESVLSLLNPPTERDEFTVKWSRNPEVYDFVFKRQTDGVSFEVVEFPTHSRIAEEKETVFVYRGKPTEIAKAFYKTFAQLYEDRETDEFEANWHQPFPVREFENLKQRVSAEK